MSTNKTITKSMFESIKNKLNESAADKAFKDIMKLEVGSTYLVRLLPNVKEPEKTFFHYYAHGWESFSTGKYVTALSPTTFGERDPIAEHRLSVRKTGTEEEKKKAEALNRREYWLANVYVINDPKNPENNGKVKMIRYGRQLQKIIMDAINGEDAADYGERIFDLSSNGCSLRIKVEKNQGGFPTYVSSKFTLPQEISDMSDKKADAVYNGTFNLESVFTVKSYDELKKMLDEHYLLNEGSVSTTPSAPARSSAPAATAPKASKPAPVEESGDSDGLETLNEEDVNELLKDLGN